MNKTLETILHLEYTLISGLIVYMQTDEFLFMRFFSWKTVLIVFFFSTFFSYGIMQLLKIWAGRKPKNGGYN